MQLKQLYLFLLLKFKQQLLHKNSLNQLCRIYVSLVVRA